MFIETHTDNGIIMTFLKSTNVQAYPCGRRRSTLVEHDFNNDKLISEDEKYRFPFDPEARLNTEANNRKHSGLNGYTQTYLISDWNSKTETTNKLILALNGYLFTIDFKNDYIKADGRKGYPSANDFATELLIALLGSPETTDVDRIYANILIEDLKFFSAKLGDEDYYTGILRNQSQLDTDDIDNTPSEALDLPIASAKNAATELKKAENYYFSGLSFSTTPLTSINEKTYNIGKTRSVEVTNIEYQATELNTSQTLVSLCILKKNADGEWEINEEARLPKIEHGDTEDSIVITGDAALKSNLYVEDNITVGGSLSIEDTINVGANINVGTPANPATDDDGGNIVAEKNITAEKDLVAKQNLEVTGTATVEDETYLKKNLIVGDDKDLKNTGTITAKKHVETPTLNASISLTTPSATVTTAGITTADITTADIATATIQEALVVNGTHTANGKINATKDLGEDNNIEATKANINTLTGSTATIDEITGTTKVSSAEFIQAGNPVPIIDVVEQTDGYWQLQLTSVSVKSKN